jgi:hypothetical protein
MKWSLATSAALAVAVATPTAFAQQACVEGETVFHATFDLNTIDAMAQAGVSCVHLRLRQDDFTGFDDPRQLGAPARTMTELWDDLIDAYRARNIEVILEVGADAMGATMDAFRDPAMHARYGALLVRVVQRYVRQVKSFELPDQANLPPRAGVPGAAALSPAEYAALVLTARQALRRDLMGSLCNDHKIVLGGLNFDGIREHLGGYLRAVYAAGLGEDGATGLWTEFRERERRLPFDIVGVRSFPPFNPLLAQGGQGFDAAEAASSVVGDVLERFEGSRTARPVWITASGLPSDGTMEQNQRQMYWVMNFFQSVGRRDINTPIALASWYAFIDPPWDRGDWGFYNDGVRLRSNERVALVHFANEMRRYRAAPRADLLWLDGPLRLLPGQVTTVHLRITNTGPDTDASAWPLGAQIRVGAAPSCPDAEDHNQIPWTGPSMDAGGGPGVFDGRVNVPFERDWTVGYPRNVSWEITAPAAPGRYSLSARLIWGADRWFGQNATTTVEVLSPPDAGFDATAEAGDVAIADAGDDVADVVDAADAVELGMGAPDVAATAPADLGAPEAPDRPTTVSVDRPGSGDAGIDAGSAPRPAEAGCDCDVAASRGRWSPHALWAMAAVLIRRRRERRATPRP